MSIVGFIKIFERIIVVAVLGMLAVVILLATVDLGREIVSNVTTSPLFVIPVDNLLGIFGLVLLILIGVELVETIKMYFVEHIVHVEVVLEVALIAVARKIIILNVKEYDPLAVIGIAALVIALTIGYYLEKRGHALDAKP